MFKKIYRDEKGRFRRATMIEDMVAAFEPTIETLRESIKEFKNETI